MRRLWSDDELDQALTELHADVSPSADGLAAAKERMLTGKPLRGRRFRRTWLPIVATAAAAALVTTTVLVLLPHTAQPAAPPVRPSPISLQDLLSKIHYSDPTVAPGQYWYSQNDGGLTGEVISIWRPANWTDEWQRHRSFITGYTATYADGLITQSSSTLNDMVEQDLWAGCGDFSQRNAPPNATHLACDNNREAPNFDWPTPDWIAGLSTNPADILAQLNSGRDGREPLFLPNHVLSTGLFPAQLRAAIYQAVAMMPGAHGLRNVPNPDGKLGYAIGFHEACGLNDELLINPADGTFLGERRYVPTTGQVRTFSAMRYGVVDKQGIKP